MNRTIRAGITGALLLGGLAGLTVLASPRTTERPLPPATFAPFTTSTPQGQIAITTDAGGKLSISYSGPLDLGELPTSVDLTPKKADRCEVVRLGDAAHLLGIDVVSYEQSSPWVADPTLASVGSFGDVAIDEIGLVDNGLGSYNQLNCNQSNGRLEPGQAFRLALGTVFPADVDINYVELDIEGKFGARLEAATDAAGANTYVAPLGNASDNNADAGSTDNDRITIGTPALADDFDVISIAPASADRRGELALEGGGDFTEVPQATRLRTVLYLGSERTYEYTLVCNSNATTIYGANTAAPGLPAGSVKGIDEDTTDSDWTVNTTNGDYPSRVRVFRYQGTLNGVAKPCPPIGADLRGEGGSDNTVILEPSDDTAFLRAELTWIIPKTLVDLANGNPFARRIDVDGDGPLPPTDARYCTSIDVTDPFNPAAAGTVGHPANTPWCVVSDTRQLTKVGGVDVVIQTMIWDGLGDPRWY